MARKLLDLKREGKARIFTVCNKSCDHDMWDKTLDPSYTAHYTTIVYFE